MIEEMNAADVSWSDAEVAIRAYLVSQGAKIDRLQRQMARVAEVIRPRLRR